MQHAFSKIELAFDSVSSQMQSMCTVYFCRTDGATYYLDDAAGIYDDLPEDFETSDDYIEIPHKNDLDLGVALVHEFMRHVAPANSNEVRSIFSRKGAYGRYKSFLVRHGLLDGWHKFEQTETEAALRQWCKDNAIELTPDKPKPGR